MSQVPHIYEFEPGSPYIPQSRQPTFNDFYRQTDRPTPSPRITVSHTKNSRSVDNTKHTDRKPIPIAVVPSPSNRIQRSESSPSLTPGQFHPSQDRTNDLYTPSEDFSIPDYYYRKGFDAAIAKSNPAQGNNSVQSTPRRPQAELLRSTRSRSPSRHNDHEHEKFRQPRSRTRSNLQDSPHIRTSPVRTRSPAKGLGDVSEEIEYDTTGQLPGHYSPYIDSPLIDSPVFPAKRSRSPMKKMFGENGWLGFSQDEGIGHNLKHKKSSLSHKDEPVSGPKKSSMMSKIKNKLEEIVGVMLYQCELLSYANLDRLRRQI